MAAAAAKAVWGENNATANNETHGQEPISGAQGDVSKGEPFDKGNIDPQPNAASVNSHEPSVAPTTTTTSTGPSTTAPTTTPKSTEPSTTTTVPHHESAQFAKTTGTAAESDKVPDNKATELKAKDTPADTSKAQNDTRDPEDPKTNPKNAPTDVDNTGEGINESPNLDAPGPKPLDELAREHGGDAGKVGDTSSKTQGDTLGDKKKDEAEDPSDPHAKSSGEGTGEKYVKTSGLQADGGDFDATKPGAGREADRLLEQKGIHVTKGVPGKSEDEGAGDKSTDKDSGSGEKKGTLTKIKEKLHRH